MRTSILPDEDAPAPNRHLSVALSPASCRKNPHRSALDYKVISEATYFNNPLTVINGNAALVAGRAARGAEAAAGGGLR
jgi:hypothetical protein